MKDFFKIFFICLACNTIAYILAAVALYFINNV